MTKQELIRDMTSYVNGSPFISKTRLARFMGKDKDFCNRYIRGLDKLPGEVKGTKYYIPDVAQRIMDERRV